MFYKYKLELITIFFILGLSLVHYFDFLKLCPAIIFFISSLIFLLIARKLKKIIFLFLAFLFLSAWRYTLLYPQDLRGRIENYYNQDFKILGQVISEPDISNDKQKIKFKIFYGLTEDNKYFKLRGQILIITDKYPTYHYGDLLKVAGDCSDPGFIEDFDYSLYLKRYGLTAVFYYPMIEETNLVEDKKNSFKTFVYKLRNKLADKFDYYLSIDSSSFIKAMILNDKSSLSSEMKTEFSKTGLSHIIAISGLHISLLSSLLLSFLILIGLKRKMAFYFILFFLFFYLFLVESPASAIRATLMAVLSISALTFGQLYDMSRILFLIGLLMLLINPLFLWADLGFVLSFLAILAIIYIHPIILSFLLKNFSRSERKQKIIEIISITISVQLLSIPILISNFKQFSVLAILGNLLILWIIPTIMVLSFLALILSFLFPFLAQLLFIVLDLLLKYILSINHFLSIIPGISVEVNSWPWYFSIVYYLIIIYFYFKWRNKKQRF
jgi:competence protein ComEC